MVWTGNVCVWGGPAPASLEEREASKRGGRGFKAEGGGRMGDEEKRQEAGPGPRSLLPQRKDVRPGQRLRPFAM